MMSMPMMMPATRFRCIYSLRRTQIMLTPARVLGHVLACVWCCVRAMTGMQHLGFRTVQRQKRSARTQTTRQLVLR